MNTLSRKLWDGITRQWTGYGRLDKEFDAYYDWMHHGESYENFYFFEFLADPTDARFGSEPYGLPDSTLTKTRRPRTTMRSSS